MHCLEGLEFATSACPKIFPLCGSLPPFRKHHVCHQIQRNGIWTFQFGSSYEWVVTKKVGRSSQSDLLAAAETEAKSIPQPTIFWAASDGELVAESNQLKEQKETAPAPVKNANMIYKRAEFDFSFAHSFCQKCVIGRGIHFYFLLFRGVTFFLVGLDLIGE